MLPAVVDWNPRFRSQYLYHCLAARAIRPGQVLPGVPEHVRELMRPSGEASKAAEGALKRLDALFPREEIVKKKDKVSGAQAFADGAKKR